MSNSNGAPRAQPQTHSLHYGGSRKPLVTVIPDDTWPAMFHVAWPDVGLSSPANLSRCLDAARCWAEAGPPRRDARGRWEWRTRPIDIPREPQGSRYTRFRRESRPSGLSAGAA